MRSLHGRSAFTAFALSIDAEWTTLSSGQHGRLRLRAAPAAQCAPADAT